MDTELFIIFLYYPFTVNLYWWHFSDIVNFCISLEDYQFYRSYQSMRFWFLFFSIVFLFSVSLTFVPSLCILWVLFSLPSNVLREKLKQLTWDLLFSFPLSTMLCYRSISMLGFHFHLLPKFLILLLFSPSMQRLFRSVLISKHFQVFQLSSIDF